MALLDPSIHFRPPLTHTSHHRPALVDLSRFIAVSGFSHSRFRYFSTCVSAILGVSLVGVSLLSADVAVAVVRPEVIFISASFHLQRSNKRPLESSRQGHDRQGAHDSTTTPNPPKTFI